MGGETATVVDAAATKERATRQRSTIGFPYMDLKAVVELADAIHANAGLGDCDDDQLAAWSHQSSKSSTFRVQVYAARTFGILEGEGSRHKLTELGRAIVDPHQSREARARAFLAVPLYKAAFEKYKGGVIPPAAALERDFISLGVAEKQKERARQVFERSAEQSGFFEHGKNRLVMPATNGHGTKPVIEAPPTEPAKNDQKNKNGGGNDGGSNQHPFIQGLLKELPPAGDEWPEMKRKLWLDTAASIFKIIYKDADA